jgi:D-alanine-D-alanine ligase
MSRLKIAIVTGGFSRERDISLVTGQRVLDALDPEKYIVSLCDAANRDALLALAAEKPDVAFVAMHGKGGEDGSIQGYLQWIGVPFTGSGVLASALALDKRLAKQLFACNGIDVPRDVVLTAASDRGQASQVGIPCVVKPNTQGSSDGVAIVRRTEDLPAAVEKALTYEDTVLVEEFITGVEITCGVLGNKTLELLPPVEIVPKGGFYDRESKYVPGATDEICPARLPDAIAKRAQNIAGQCHALLGCRGMSRTDMIVSGNRIVVLETNTMPGMTGTSLLPREANVAGYSFGQLLDRIIGLARE